MKKAFKPSGNRAFIAHALVFGALCVLTLGVWGCGGGDDDHRYRNDDRTIRVCNYDDRDYDVVLYRESDGTAFGEFNLESWFDIGEKCDTFENAPEDRYFLAIYREGSDEIYDLSDDFYLDDGDFIDYWIDSTGDLVREGNEKVIRICNYDDEDYTVRLRRYADGLVIAEFELEAWYEFGDKCDAFDNVPEDQYYITIHEDGAAYPASQTDDFHFEDYDIEYFWIDDSGDIHRD